MRLLRDFADERSAELLSDALRDQGIDNELKATKDGEFAVWVLDEAQRDTASALATRWFDAGDRKDLERAAMRGQKSRELKQRIEQRKQQKLEALAEHLQRAQRPRPAPLTFGLIALCVGVFVLTNLGDIGQFLHLKGHANYSVDALKIVDTTRPVPVYRLPWLFDAPWLALPVHEPWRLITPVLLHFGIMHLFFNMLMLGQLGTVIERVHGTRYLAAFILLSGVVSNIAQYELAASANFAGSSGVVFGLLGLIWLRGHLEPRVGYALSRSTAQFMLIWLVLGFIGNFGIANWCHLFGLLVGIAWAFVAARFSRR